MSTAEQSTFQNESMQIELKKEPGCKIILDIFVTPKAAKEKYLKAIDLVKKEISVPGFRKGKAPNSMVLQNYAKYVDKEWKDLLLESSFEESLALTKIYPFGQKSVKSASIKSASQEDGAKLSYEYESSPNVPEINPETLSIPTVEVKEITQKDVDEALEKLQNEQGTWTDITDRAAQEGDFVQIDIDNIGENPGNICTDQWVALKEDKAIEWMQKLILNMIPGQTVEGMSENEHPEDCAECDAGTHTHPKFAPTLCRITLHKINQVEPHPLNDDLAKKYGAENIQTFVEHVKRSLENQAKEEKFAQERRFLERELLKNYAFELPGSLIREEIKLLRERLPRQLHSEGLEGDKLKEESLRIEQEAIHKYMYDFTLYFLTQKYARTNNITASPDEVSLELMRQMLMARMGQNTLDPDTDPQELQAQIKMQIIAGKAITQMIEKTTKLPKKA